MFAFDLFVSYVEKCSVRFLHTEASPILHFAIPTPFLLTVKGWRGMAKYKIGLAPVFVYERRHHANTHMEFRQHRIPEEEIRCVFDDI